MTYATVHHLNPFITNYIFYPQGTNILWANADAPVALAWITMPITLWLGPVVSYNLLQTLALPLSAWTAFIAIRPLVNRAATALVGGLLYGFGSYMMAHAYGHLGLTMAWISPLIAWLLYRLVVLRNASPIWVGIAAGLLEVFQLLTAAELVVTEALFAIAGLVWLAILARLTRWQVPWGECLRRLAIAGAVALAIFFALAAYPLSTLMHGPGRVTVSPVRPWGTYVMDLLNLIVPTGQTNLIHTAWTEQKSQLFYGEGAEASGYLGVLLIALLLFTLARWRRDPRVLFAAGLFGLAVVLSLGPDLAVNGVHYKAFRLPWRAFHPIPLLREVLPVRLTMYGDLFAGFLLSFFLDNSLASARLSRRAAAVVAATASVGLLLPSLPWLTSTAHVPTVFQPGTDANRYFVSVAPEGSVAVVMPAFSLRRGLGYSMLWQAWDGYGFKMPEGDLLRGGPDGRANNGPDPGPLWTAMFDLQQGIDPPAEEADLAAVRAQLQDFGVRAIVLGPMPHEDQALNYFSQLTGKQPVDLGDAHMWTVG